MKIPQRGFLSEEVAKKFPYATSVPKMIGDDVSNLDDQKFLIKSFDSKLDLRKVSFSRRTHKDALNLKIKKFDLFFRSEINFLSIPCTVWQSAPFSLEGSFKPLQQTLEFTSRVPESHLIQK